MMMMPGDGEVFQGGKSYAFPVRATGDEVHPCGIANTRSDTLKTACFVKVLAMLMEHFSKKRDKRIKN